MLLLGWVLATKGYATYLTFVALVIAAYSAVLHSRFRGAALLTLVPAGVLISAGFWQSTSLLQGKPIFPIFRVGQRLDHVVATGASPMPDAPWRLTGVLVLVSLSSIAVVGVAVYTADRIRRLRSEHEDATRRAVELERARIASELHDVVTHNVSVMIVQAGAARHVLASNPAQATEALLAVESSGRAAMTELRSLLGLLNPAPERGATAPDGTGEHANDLRPQPGLGQVEALVVRVRAAGLPVEFDAGSVPEDLPPGVDLAAFRIIQEALTNVLKHAGKPRTAVRLCYADGDLIVEVTDAGRPIPAAGPICAGAGRGLLGLRERTALYGGELVAGPAPDGGWRVRARIPADPLAEVATAIRAAPR